MDEEKKTYWTDDDDLVAKYVLGQLTPEEKERLDAEIADVEPAKAKLREETEIAAGIRRHGRDFMKMQLRTKLRRSRAAQFNSNHYVGLAAAVLIVAIGIGAYQIWFSDLVAPTKFHQEQEVVLTPPDDTVEDEQQPEENEHQAAEKQTTQAEQGPSKSPAGHKRAAGSTPEKSMAELSETPQQKSPPPAAMAEADEASASVGSSQSIWLIGTVVMISDRTDMPSLAAGQNERVMKREQGLSKEKSAETIVGGAVAVKRRAKDAGIILQQRAIKDLPAGFTQRKDSRRQSVQTLLERSDAGISLTLYGDAVNEEDLQEAVVEQMTDDSLVVSLPHQRIAFRLPAGWNSQPARR